MGVSSYVYEAGATESPIDDEGKTQPYYDNPVFLEKLDKFVEAFAKEYDNPDEVDYIDAYGLGRWGRRTWFSTRKEGEFGNCHPTGNRIVCKAF